MESQLTSYGPRITGRCAGSLRCGPTRRQRWKSAWYSTKSHRSARGTTPSSIRILLERNCQTEPGRGSPHCALRCNGASQPPEKDPVELHSLRLLHAANDRFPRPESQRIHVLIPAHDRVVWREGRKGGLLAEDDLPLADHLVVESEDEPVPGDEPLLPALRRAEIRLVNELVPQLLFQPGVPEHDCLRWADVWRDRHRGVRNGGPVLKGCGVLEGGEGLPD